MIVLFTRATQARPKRPCYGSSSSYNGGGGSRITGDSSSGKDDSHDGWSRRNLPESDDNLPVGQLRIGSSDQGDLFCQGSRVAARNWKPVAAVMAKVLV